MTEQDFHETTLWLYKLVKAMIKEALREVLAERDEDALMDCEEEAPQ